MSMITKTEKTSGQSNLQNNIQRVNIKDSTIFEQIETEKQKELRLEKTGDVYKANQVRNYVITDFCDNINELDEHLADKLEIFNEKFTNLLPVNKRWKRFSDYLGLKIWVFIFIVAIACALNGCAINYLGQKLSAIRFYSND